MHVRVKQVLAAAVAVALLTPLQSGAQAPVRKPKPFTIGLGLATMGIDPVTAEQQAVHDQSWGLQFDVGYVVKRHLWIAADIGPHILSDHAGFTQATTAGNKKSTAGVTYVSGLIGPRTSEFNVGGKPVMLALYGGASGSFGSRSIDNCVDCYTEKVKIPAGGFVQPTVLVGTRTMRVRIAHRQYFGDGIKYVTSLGLELGARN